MTDEEERYLYHLQGRIIASEKITEALLLALACHQANWGALNDREPDPLSELDSIEKALVGGMQHTTFHSSDGSDASNSPDDLTDVAWEAAGESIRLRFKNVRAKLKNVGKAGDGDEA